MEGSPKRKYSQQFGPGRGQRLSPNLYFYPDSPDRTSAYEMNDGFKKEKVTAPFARGDDDVETHQVEQIAFLKIDVEGMEMDVLAGFETTLRRGAIKGIQFEHGPAHVISRHFLKDFVDFLEPLQYTIFRSYPNALRAVAYILDPTRRLPARTSSRCVPNCATLARCRGARATRSAPGAHPAPPPCASASCARRWRRAPLACARRETRRRRAARDPQPNHKLTRTGGAARESRNRRRPVSRHYRLATRETRKNGRNSLKYFCTKKLGNGPLATKIFLVFVG